MTAPLPPCGPERDALVADALGCMTWVLGDGDTGPIFGCFCDGDPLDPTLPHEVARECSTTDAGAIAALEAWRKGGPDRIVTIILDSRPDTTWVKLDQPDAPLRDGVSAPTLGDAASQAIIAASKEGA